MVKTNDRLKQACKQLSKACLKGYTLLASSLKGRTEKKQDAFYDLKVSFDSLWVKDK